LGAGGAAGGAGGAIDAPAAGAGGAIDAGLGGAGGFGLDGAIVDVSLVGTGGAGGSIDGGFDVPLGGAGGGSGSGGRTGTGGTARTGGRTGSGGARTGGATGTGGARTGGAPGSGGSMSPDVGPDLGPEAGPDLGPDANPLLVGLVAYYKCDETSGGTLADSSGNGYSGTLNGTASFGAGKVGNALVLAASGSSYASLPPAVFSGLGDFTIATWVHVTASTYQDWMRIFDAGINAGQETAPRTGTQYMNLTPRNNDGNLRWTITKNGIAGEESLNTSSLLADAWKHVTVVLTGGIGRLYVDGVDVNSPQPETAMKPSDIKGMDYAYLGKSQFAVDAYFDGMLDEFRVYSRALSATEVQALFQFAGP
jgi:hypothetical protein